MNNVFYKLRYNRFTNWLRYSKYTSQYSNAIHNKWLQYFVRKKGISELSNMTNALTEKGVIAFADFGTLLGVVRDGNIIPHDLDIDVGVIVSKGICEVVKTVFRENGFWLWREYTVGGKIAEQSYRGNHIKIDIQYYYADSDGTMYCHLFYNMDALEQGKCQAVVKNCSRVNDVTMIVVDGHSIMIPSNADELLECKYGDSWRIPDKGWVYWEGPNTRKIEEFGKMVEFDETGRIIKNN